jgi:hypothetical protein
MQEYFNIDVESNFSLGTPQEINNRKGEAAILPSAYREEDNPGGPITIMTPPLRCSRVRVWPGKNNKYSKCVIELETTENEWRFTQFLSDLSGKCRYIITENAREWFKYAFSASTMRDSYVNPFIQKNYSKPCFKGEEEKIQIQLGKLLLNDLDKQTAKSYKNQYLVLRLVFKGVLVSAGIFSEVWRADQIFKARPNMNDTDESEYDDDYYEDIGETVMVNPKSKQKNKENFKVEKLNGDGNDGDSTNVDYVNNTSENPDIYNETTETNTPNTNVDVNNTDLTTENNDEPTSQNSHKSLFGETQHNDVVLTVNEVNDENKRGNKPSPDSIICKASDDASKASDNNTENGVDSLLEDIPKVVSEPQPKKSKKKKARKKRIIISNNRRRKW